MKWLTAAWKQKWQGELVMKSLEGWELSQRFIDSKKASWDLLPEFLHRQFKKLVEYAPFKWKTCWSSMDKETQLMRPVRNRHKKTALIIRCDGTEIATARRYRKHWYDSTNVRWPVINLLVIYSSGEVWCHGCLMDSHSIFFVNNDSVLHPLSYQNSFRLICGSTQRYTAVFKLHFGNKVGVWIFFCTDECRA